MNPIFDICGVNLEKIFVEWSMIARIAPSD